MTTIFKIYYTHPETSTAQSIDCEKLADALSISETMRKKGMSFVTIVSESTDFVGKTGVSSVSDGKLPDGNAYTYTKRDALSQRTKNLTDEVEVPLE